jgi:23S rRNA (adenine2503-C2)-methyltransferase
MLKGAIRVNGAIQINEKKVELRSLSLNEMVSLVESLGEKKFRGKQLYAWVHRGVRSIDEMTDLSAGFRQRLQSVAFLENISVVEALRSEHDQTTKYLFRLKDDNVIEAVRMVYRHGVSACLSTQIGCRMGCTFCASTLDGMVRNLTAGEMLGQLLEIQTLGGVRVSNVVLMGSGEPLDNFEEVTKFIDLACSEEGLNLGQRHITLSTCGIVPGIYALAEKNYQITLAISLHSVEDAVRSKLMPVNRKYPLTDVIRACDDYAQKTGRRVTYEYALIQGENDQESEAVKLAKLLKGKLCHVNLIPVNPVLERGFKASNDQAVRRFSEVLKKAGIETTVRRELGSDINAACGQLRKSYLDQSEI